MLLIKCEDAVAEVRDVKGQDDAIRIKIEMLIEDDMVELLPADISVLYEASKASRGLKQRDRLALKREYDLAEYQLGDLIVMGTIVGTPVVHLMESEVTLVWTIKTEFEHELWAGLGAIIGKEIPVRVSGLQLELLEGVA